MSSTSETQITLRNLSNSSARTYALSKGMSVVGRDPACALVLADASVSRFHAELLVEGRGVTVRDLKSRNGTYVDGKRIKTFEAQAGQVLHFGCVRLQLEMAGEGRGEARADAETQTVSDVLQAASSELDKLPLSVAERRVFDLLLPGLAEKEIAHRLAISRHTVHSHVRKIYEVFDVRSRAELLAHFIPRPNNKSPGTTRRVI